MKNIEEIIVSAIANAKKNGLEIDFEQARNIIVFFAAELEIAHHKEYLSDGKKGYINAVDRWWDFCYDCYRKYE